MGGCIVKDSFLKETGFVLKEAMLRFRVIAAVAFGSQVKGLASSFSDIDLLVVAEGINPKRHRRGEEIAEIKQALPALFLDLLLLTRGEAISNFENHNPLFLDIACEGVVILDEDSFVENLMAETREYIRQKGIKKLEGGWAFPVQQGVATPLSKVSNEDFALAMLKDGERDLAIGKKLAEEAFYDKAVYHFQQAVEKCLKSVLIAKGIFQRTHFVGEVLRRMLETEDFPAGWRRDLLEAAQISAGMEPEVSLSRYPGIIGNNLWLPFEEYEKEDADKAYREADKVVAIAKRFVKEWFSEPSSRYRRYS
jgi:HEPN domain-containing protein/predicted nucleotidyltransferase